MTEGGGKRSGKEWEDARAYIDSVCDGGKHFDHALARNELWEGGHQTKRVG